ncbi:MAG: hypothetical protein HF973_02075, partial [Chloroflexi bacterium]|nr:hypothetical protein [Chloroflexota bacterium]
MRWIQPVILVLFTLVTVACASAPDKVAQLETVVPDLPTATPQPTSTSPPTAVPQPSLEPLTRTTIDEAVTDPSPPLQLADYPPNDTPYLIENDNVTFWLVHTPASQLMAFPVTVPGSTTADQDACRLAWDEAAQQFTDPCSGNRWGLDGRLDTLRFTAPPDSRDLSQYPVAIMDGAIFVQFHALTTGQPLNAPPPISDAQYGVTMTVRAADFSPAGTTLEIVKQVDPRWQMAPNAFPPQQALTYPTFPDSLVDDQGRAIPPMGGESGLVTLDPAAGGIRQTSRNTWEAVPADATAVTATLTVNLDNLYREVTLPLDWNGRQPGAVWQEEYPLEIGYAGAQITQIEWLETTDDGRAVLRLTVLDDSPEDIHLFCLHLAVQDPWSRFDDSLRLGAGNCE